MYCDPDGFQAQAICNDGENQDNDRLWGHKHLDGYPWTTSPKKIAEASYKAYKTQKGISSGATILDIGDVSPGKMFQYLCCQFATMEI